MPSKIIYNIWEDLNELPSLRMEQITCERCHYQFEVPSEFIDYRKENEDLRKMHKTVVDEIFELIEECGKVWDVPAKEWFEMKSQVLIMKMQSMLEELQ